VPLEDEAEVRAALEPTGFVRECGPKLGVFDLSDQVLKQSHETMLWRTATEGSFSR